MSRLLILVLLVLAAGCAHRERPPLGSSVTLLPAEPGKPTDWRSLASAGDAAAVDALPLAWPKALAAAKSASARAVSAEASLLEPTARLPRATLVPGRYHCRVVRIGTSPQSPRAYEKFASWFCFVAEVDGQLTFVKATGTQLPAGRLWEESDTRLVFLGTTAVVPGAQVRAYGWDAVADRIAIIERIGDFKWRMVSPARTVGGAIEIVELIPDVASPLQPKRP